MLRRCKGSPLVVQNYSISMEHACLLCLYVELLVAVAAFIEPCHYILSDETFSCDGHQSLAAVSIDDGTTDFCSALIG